MTDIELKSKRLTCSILALEKIKEFLIDHSELRLEQALSILDDRKDYFNEEPWDTLKRWEEKLEAITKN